MDENSSAVFYDDYTIFLLNYWKDIDTYLDIRRQRSDALNKDEFSGTIFEDDDDCSSRTNPKLLDRNKHMKTAVIDNQDRFLNRSIVTENKKASIFVAAEERLRNIETHLGIVVAPIDKDMFTRIRILEEKILKIEQHYPQIAAHCFNYGKAEKEASSRPGGRVSKPDHLEKSGILKKSSKKGNLATSASSTSASIVDLKSKLSKLKEKLIMKKN